MRRYFASINAGHYARAWALGGRNSGAGSYQAYVQGFSQTDSSKVTILSVSGNSVTARLRALQSDGTTSTYQGTYVVEGGVITQFSVQQIS